VQHVSKSIAADPARQRFNRKEINNLFEQNLNDISPEKSPPMINLEVDLGDDEHFYNHERIESIESFTTI